MVTLCDLSVHVHKGIQVSQIPVCSQSPINNNDYYPHKARFPLKRNAHNWSVRKLAEENANLRVLPSTTVKKVLGVGSILVVACTYCQPRTTCFSKTSPTRAANLNLRWREGERRSDKETASDGKRKIEQRETKRTRERKNEGRGEWKTKFGRRQRREGERERGGRLCGGVGQFSTTPYQNLADVQKHTQECVSEPVLMTMRGLGHAYVMGT